MLLKPFPKKRRSISNAPGLQTVSETASIDQKNVRDWLRSQRAHAPQRDVRATSPTPSQKPQQKADAASADSIASQSNVFPSVSRTIFSDGAERPTTVAKFLTPDFKRGFVFDYSVVVNAVLQRYSRHLQVHEPHISDVTSNPFERDAPSFEQNPTEIWLPNVAQLYRDKVFMKQRKEQERLYLAQRSGELGSKSADTFVTLRKGASTRTSCSKMTSSTHSKKNKQNTKQRSSKP